MSEVPEREIVAIRTEDAGGHEHIVGVKLSDDTEESATEVLEAINSHEAHYVMRRPGLPAPLLVHPRQCPDCAERVLFA
jgi:hypothetical protein